MKIQRVSCVSNNLYVKNNSSNGINKPVAKSASYDCFNFTGARSYDILLKHAVQSKYVNQTQIIDSFEILFNALKNASRMNKHQDFELLADLFSKTNVYEFFRTLATAKQDSAVGKMVSKAADEAIVLFGTKDEPFLDMFNWGFRKSKGTNDVVLTFYGIDKSNIEFGLNKKGGWKISQYDGENSIITEFYKDTGTAEKITVQYKDYAPESTFYDKDGKKPFWKNFLRGGYVPQGN